MASGIYKITNTINGKVYVGSASYLESRKRTHFANLRKNKHPNCHLQRAWNLYGDGVFIWEKLEECKICSLRIQEQAWMDRLNACDPNKGYNISPQASGFFHSVETKEKMRLARLGKKISQETKDKISAANSGLKRSEEQRRKQSDRMIGHIKSIEARRKLSQSKMGKKMSAATRSKMSLAKKGRPLSLEHIKALTGIKHSKQSPGEVNTGMNPQTTSGI